MKKRAVISSVILCLIVCILAGIFLPNYIEKANHQKLVNILAETKFDKYYNRDKFSNKTFIGVMADYVGDNSRRFDVKFTSNKKMPQYEQIKEGYDTVNYDYVCAQIQVLEPSLGDKYVVNYVLNAYFSIHKTTKNVIPFGIATENNDFEITYIKDPEGMINNLYTTIELFMKYVG